MVDVLVAVRVTDDVVLVVLVRVVVVVPVVAKVLDMDVAELVAAGLADVESAPIFVELPSGKDCVAIAGSTAIDFFLTASPWLSGPQI